jgi:Ca2+-transporting ATPase
MATEVGHISGMLAEEQDVKTPLTRQMDRLEEQILVIAGIALVASMALNLARGETFHRMKSASGREVIRCFVKGAPDQLLARAATVAGAGAGPAQADGEFRQRYLAENQRLAEQGLRVIATARKDFDPAAFDPGADLLPLVTGLELLALAGIVDPPRPTARASIATATKAGIRVRMITGDYAVTAAAVAGQLGIDGAVLTGAE